MQNFDEIPQQVYKTTYGDFWLPERTESFFQDPVMSAIKANQLFEKFVVNLCEKFITPGSTVIDVGANFGQMTLQWSKMVGPTGFVHSFECSDMISSFLKKTIAHNSVVGNPYDTSNVRVHQKAVWHTSDVKLKMLRPDGSPHGQQYSGMGVKGADNLDPRNMSSYEVDSIKIDDIEYESKVSVIKVDAQGSDFFALTGAKNTIIKHKPFVIVEYETWYDSIFEVSFQALENYLKELGYEQRPDLIDNKHDFAYTPKQ